jgi:hypothetical protein
MAKKTFPKMLYVQFVRDTDGEEYPLAAETLQEAAESDLLENEAGEYVAEYELKQIGSLEIKPPIFVSKVAKLDKQR